MRQVITTFTGVEHRLQFVGEHNRAAYYNDSIATSPERLMAALHAFTGPIVLLAGGRDKHLPWTEAARLMLRKTRAVILFGESAELIAEELDLVRDETVGEAAAVHRCVALDEAVSMAARVAQPGDVVLLSPGCASYDAFRNFIERGERFKALVQAL